MAVEFGKGIRVASSFDLDEKVPLDSRITVATIADRDAHVTENRAYEGMLVYVEADKTLYQYIDSLWKPLLGDLDDRLNTVESQLGLGEGSSISGRVDSLEQKVGAPASDENEASGLFSNISSLETKDTELKSEIDIISDALSNEIDRATTAEEANKAAINKEILDRQNAISDHGTHVTYESNVPQANGTASVGTSTSVSRGDHVHPLQTEVSGNAGTATKLKTPVNINGVAFDGSKDITIEDNTKVKPTGTIVANHVAVFNDTTGKIIKDSGFTIAKSVPADAKFTDTTYEEATTSQSGLMSSTDKSKLDGIEANANNYTHPTKHEASMIIEDNTHMFVTDEEKNKWNNKSDFDGNYNNLTNKPSIPTKTSELENDSVFVTNTELDSKGYLTEHQDISGKVDKISGYSLVSDAEIDRLATLENYDDTNLNIALDNLTNAINKTQIDKSTIPTKTSELINDSGFITSIPNEYVTDSELNSKGYLTEHQDISGKVDKVNGYSLVSDAEISRLATLENYDDTEVRELVDEINTSLDNLESEVNELKEGNINIDLTNYATKDYVDEAINNAKLEGGDTQVDLSTYAKKTDLHDHSNKTVLDSITTSKVNQWNNMSNGNNVSSLLIDLKSLGVMEGNNAEIIENNTAILQSLIEQYPKGQMTFYLSKGTYYFNPIDLTKISGNIIIRLKGENNGMSTSWFKGIFTTIKTNMQDFIYDRRSDSPGITFYVDDIEFYSFDGYKNIPTGVCFGAEVNGGKEYNFHFYNVLIHGFDYGFKSPGYSCAGSGGKNITLSTCHYGIYIKSTSHLFQADCVNLTYNRVGIRFGYGGSPCSISNIHVANGYLGSDKDDFDRFIVIHTKGGTHISNIYQEAYESNAQPEKTTIIDYEGWAYGTGAVIVENTPIAIPSGNGGLFFKGRTFLGAGTEEGVDNPIELYSGNLDHYPNGCVKFINCKIENNVDISSIFDVPAQSPGYDINNKLFYKDSKIINKNNIGKVNSKWTYTVYNITSVTEGDNMYNIYNNANFDEPYNGFKVSELRVFKNFYSKTNIKLKGNIIIEDTLSDTLDASIGFMHRYYIDNVINYKFYPVTTLKASQGVSSFPFDFIIERVTGEDYRTEINICTMFKNETNKLKATDFDKIRFKFDIEVYRD